MTTLPFILIANPEDRTQYDSVVTDQALYDKQLAVRKEQLENNATARIAHALQYPTDSAHSAVAGDSTTDSAPLGMQSARNRLPSQTSKLGRPRRYTGPGWDELTNEEYRIKSRRENDRLQNIRRTALKNGDNVLLLPVLEFQQTSYPVRDEFAIKDAHQKYYEAELTLKNGIDEFRKWLADQNEIVRAAKARYVSVNV